MIVQGGGEDQYTIREHRPVEEHGKGSESE
jgi:hypothetical protein